MHSERCPVCEGCGDWPKVGLQQRPCHGCDGKGWVAVGDSFGAGLDGQHDFSDHSPEWVRLRDMWKHSGDLGYLPNSGEGTDPIVIPETHEYSGGLPDWVKVRLRDGESEAAAFRATTEAATEDQLDLQAVATRADEPSRPWTEVKKDLADATIPEADDNAS